MKKVFLTLMILTMNCSVFANTSQMNVTLIKMINQLQTMKGLIEEIKYQQDENPRIKIHVDSWIDLAGKKHNGLRDDIDLIQKSLIEIVNNEESMPHEFDSLSNDFIGKDHV